MSESSPSTHAHSRWQRFWHRLAEVAEAMDTSETEILHNRVSRLELEVAELRMSVARTSTGSAIGPGETPARV